MENTSFNASSSLLYKRNSLLNASSPLLFKVTLPTFGADPIDNFFGKKNLKQSIFNVLLPNLQAVFTGGYEIILIKSASLHHGHILPLELLLAFVTVSLRRLTITSMILAIREVTA
jgi:hypothetical protein